MQPNFIYSVILTGMRIVGGSIWADIGCWDDSAVGDGNHGEDDNLDNCQMLLNDLYITFSSSYHNFAHHFDFGFVWFASSYDTEC